MKTIFKILLILIIGLSPNIGKAQTQNLTKVLEDFSARYEVYFSYDVNALKKDNTDFTFNENESLSDALSRLLKPLNISYESVGDKFYVLEKMAASQDSNNILTKNKTKGNTLSFQLIDERDDSYIFNAFIFVRNSSVGTTSDLEGRVELEIEGREDVEIVITHLNYETLTLPISQFQKGNGIVQLRAKAIGMEEVLVKSKKINSKKRKQWMKRFQPALFGKVQKRKKVKLLNPEVVWFEENENTLTAHAVDYLSLVNEQLGYKMQFYLDTFSIDRNDDVVFSGKVFFEDIKSQISNKRKCERLRKKTFRNSQALFFKNLIRGRLEESLYDVGISSKIKGLDSLHYEAANIKDLPVSYGLQYDTIFIGDYLTVVHANGIRNFMQMRGNKIFRVTDLDVSFFHSRTGWFIFNKQGILVNQKDIEESGYWADYRMASRMPIDYLKDIATATTPLPRLMLDSLNAYKAKAGEKIYLHLNKPFYSNREGLWFKAYLVDAVAHTSRTLSKVVYVDLINPKDSIIRSWTLHTDKIMYADFQFNSNLIPGRYRLRAYTNYMRNFDQDYFFEKTISVYDFSEDVVSNSKAVSVSVESDNNNLTSQPISMRFFPEGGDLVSGLSSKVAFQVTDSKGLPLEVTATIEDELGNPMSKIKTLHEGVGFCNMTPESGKTYKAVFSHTTGTYSFPMPQHLPEGMTLKVNNSKAEQVLVQSAATKEEDLEDAYIIGHVRGEIFCYLPLIESNQIIKINREIIPEGLAHFTLFDGKGLPQAERLIYNESLTADFDEDEKNEIEAHVNSLLKVNDIPDQIKANDQLKLSLQLDEELLQQRVNLSATVVDHTSVKYPEHGENIRNYLLLNADLPAPIPNPGFYFEREQTKEKRFLLDLMLMTHGWRRFTWRDLLESKNKARSYAAESGYSIKGYTTHKDKEDRTRTEIMLNSFDHNMIYKKLLTDSEGNFQFENLPALDTTTYFLQGRLSKKAALEEDNEKTAPKGNRLVDFHLEKMIPPPIKPLPYNSVFTKPVVPVTDHLQAEYQQAKNRETNYEEVAWELDIEEISVTAKKSFSSNRPSRGGIVKSLNLDNMPWIPESAMGVGLLARLAPTFTYSHGAENKLYKHTTDFQGRPVLIPVVIIIDGMGYDPTGSDAGWFLALAADDIATIVVGGAFIAITTRRPPRSLERYLESGILPIKHPGYSNAREFYQPAQPKSSGLTNLSTAIHWQPELQFGADGKGLLEFPATGNTSVYELRIEGVSSEGEIIFESVLIPFVDKVKSMK